jgi:tetratricopeptide (TPR) repeat protein
MIKSSWYLIPAAFFLLVNFLVSPVKIFFFWRVVYFLFFISLFFFLKRFDLNKIIKFSVGGASAIIFIYGIIQKFILFPHYIKTISPQENFYSQAIIARVESGRIFSIFSLPALYAIVCGIFIIFILHYALISRNKIFWIILMVLGLINLILTQSFGGLLYLSVGILFYLFMSGILKLKFLAPVVMLISLFFFVVAGLRFSEFKRLDPIKLRVSNWNQSLRIIETSPLLGVGLGNYEAEISFHVKSGESSSIYSHNFFLQFVAETGLIFPVFLLIILFFQRKRLTLPQVKDQVLYSSAFFILLFYNLLDIGFYFFSASLAMTIVLSQIYFRRKEQNLLGNRGFKTNLAILFFLGVLMIFQSIASGFQKKGDFLLNQKDYENAETSYTKCLAVNPFCVKSKIGMAFIDFEKSAFKSSKNHLQDALTLYPESAFGHYLMSRIRYQENRFFNSFIHASKAHKKDRLNPQYQKWYTYLRDNIQNRFPATDS